MGETQMGKFSFASWTLHMASIIIFSTMWGWILHEWKGSSKKAHLLIAGGIVTLVFHHGHWRGRGLDQFDGVYPSLTVSCPVRVRRSPRQAG